MILKISLIFDLRFVVQYQKSKQYFFKKSHLDNYQLGKNFKQITWAWEIIHDCKFNSSENAQK